MPETRDLTNTRYRSISLERASTGESVPAILATEAPVERWGYVERFDLSSAANVDTSRQPLPLLVGHDASGIPAGTVTNVRVQGRRIRGDVTFSSSPLGQELAAAAAEGILRSLSVGYQILDFDEPVRGEIRVRRLELLEVSCVAVPADPNAELFRSLPMTTDTDTDTPRPSRTERRAMHEAREQREAEQRAADAVEIRRIAKSMPHMRLGDVAEDLIEAGGTVEDMRAAARHAITHHVTHPPVRNQSLFWVEGGDRWDARQNRMVPAGPAGRISGGEPVASGMFFDERDNRPRVPRDRIMRAFGRVSGNAERDAYSASMQILAELGHNHAQRWVRDQYGSRALGVSVFSKGGALVPEELSSAIIDLREEYGVARSFCKIEPMGSDTRNVPRRTGGLTAYFSGEGDALTESEMGWDAVGLVARKLHVLSRFSSELDEDATIDVAATLADEGGYAFAVKEDECLFAGDATSTYGGITGLGEKMDSSSLAGVVEAASGVDTFAEVTITDLVNVVAALPKYARVGAGWYCSQQAAALVFQRLALNAGGATMLETGQHQMGSYAGFPIRISQALPTTAGTINGSAMLYFGNLRRASMLGDRRGVRMQLLTEKYADTDEIGVKMTERFDLVVHDVGDTTTAGPIVALWGKTS